MPDANWWMNEWKIHICIYSCIHINSYAPTDYDSSLMANIEPYDFLTLVMFLHMCRLLVNVSTATCGLTFVLRSNIVLFCHIAQFQCRLNNIQRKIYIKFINHCKITQSLFLVILKKKKKIKSVRFRFKNSQQTKNDERKKNWSNYISFVFN